MSKDLRENPKYEFTPSAAQSSSVQVKPKVEVAIASFTAADMRAAFQQGADFARRNPFVPAEINAVKWAEEAARRWPD
jgi:hypothetical protein